MKNQEIRYYKQDCHPIIEYIKKQYFPESEEDKEKYLNSIILKKHKGKQNGSRVFNHFFIFEIEGELKEFTLTLDITFDRKVEEGYIVIIERNNVYIRELQKPLDKKDAVRLLLSDTGNFIIMGSNSSPRSTNNKEELTKFLFGKYYLNKKLQEKMPAKNNVKRSKI